LAHRPTHHAVLFGSILARRLHPPVAKVGLAAESFHPGHPPTLARRTPRRWLVRRWRRLGVRRHRPCGAFRLLKQSAAQLARRLAAPVREQPIMAETLETRGQDMAQEPPDELDGIADHQSVTVPMGIVFPPNGPPPILQGHQTPMRDRHAMRIAREILHYLSRSTSGWLGVHPPLRGLEGGQDLLPPLRSGERVALPLPHPGALHVRLTESSEEQPAEHAPQDTDRQAEGRPTGSPLRPVE
jgi:hypothetical protein